MTDGIRATRREWLGLAVIALPCMLYSMDLTVLNLALPRIAADLRPSGATKLWIIDIYGFFVASLLITMGNLGDRIGRRRLLLIGATAFGVASVVAAMSRTTGMLIVARAVLGIAGATLAPSTLSLIRNMFLDPRQRTVAIGVWTASYSTGGAIGPLLGGLVLQRFHWGSVFLLGVPVMALLLVTGPLLLPESRNPSAKRLDLGSAVLSLAAVLSAIYGLKISVQDGVTRLPLLAVGIGIGLGALFVRRQRHLAEPLVELRLFRTRAFSVSLATYLLVTLVTFGAYVVVGQHLQLVAGLSPLGAGVWMLPWSASYVFGSFLSPLLARRVQPAYVMARRPGGGRDRLPCRRAGGRPGRAGDHRRVHRLFAGAVPGLHAGHRRDHRYGAPGTSGGRLRALRDQLRAGRGAGHRRRRQRRLQPRSGSGPHRLRRGVGGARGPGGGHVAREADGTGDARLSRRRALLSELDSKRTL